MKHRIAQILPLVAVFLVSFVALGATLGVALLARAGATRVAVFATSDAWRQIEAAGLPVVRLTMGGLLIVVDGAGAPGALMRLRAGTPYVIDASLIPGCETPFSPSKQKVRS